MRTRIALGVLGVALGLFGVFRLLTQIDTPDLIQLLIWLVVAVALHDGVLSPVLLAVGAALARIPARARAVLQAALVVGALITVIALPLIHRAYTLPSQKAILRQDYGANLGILLAIVAGGALLLYAFRVVRTWRRPAEVSAPSAAPPPAADR
ncbi:hypothetical protein [uncultured Jatrophihabitans sp.]|uniref:hypothetical protein n=1 Tax=uncultured Jatrophihabitans sp. TaxID=1610747 RepID=UPI0035CA6E1D